MAWKRGPDCWDLGVIYDIDRCDGDVSIWFISMGIGQEFPRIPLSKSTESHNFLQVRKSSLDLRYTLHNISKIISMITRYEW